MEQKHPLYFVVETEEELEARAKNKIKRYFTIRRDSGGGDCGEVEKVGGRLYKISFDFQEDQERVLRRKNHNIPLPSGIFLPLTVSRTAPEPDTTAQTTTEEPDASKCLEKAFKIDIFLWSYLHECGKALNILQKQFSSIGCTAELNYEQKVVVVRANAKNGLGGAFSGVPEKWPIQVDRVWSSFQESFTCYHAVNPQISQSISQDKSFADDDVKVYPESGYSVVVGEAKAVNKKLQNIERNLKSKTELSTDEKQFNLIEEDFRREMGKNLLNVEIARSGNKVVLEGLESEVCLGLAVYEKVLKRIQQKSVQFSPDLQYFLTKSTALKKYNTQFLQYLKSPVSLEQLNVDLVLSSLSMEAINEANAILQRDFTEDVGELKDSFAADLKKMQEFLTKGIASINGQECRIGARFVHVPSGTSKVHIFGYSDSVSQFKNQLEDYLLNHVPVKDMILLSDPEIALNVDNILTLIAPKSSQVSIKALAIPQPHVLLSGPQQLVQKTKLEIAKELSSLISDTLEIDGPGARQYFKAEGKSRKEMIERLNQVVIRDIDNVKDPEVVKDSVPAKSPPAQSPPAKSPPAQSPPAKSPPAQSPPAKSPPAKSPPPQSPPAQSPPAPTSPPNKPPPSQPEAVVRRKSSVEINKVKVKIKMGSLLNEHVDVLVVPMLKKSLQSTQIGKSLAKKGGLPFKMKFRKALPKSVAPGEVVEVTAPAALNCSKLFFIECLPNYSLQRKVLRIGLKRCLELCVEQGHDSVALPLMGLANELPLMGLVNEQDSLIEAAQLLTEELREFGRSTVSSTVLNIHIVIQSDDGATLKTVHKVLKLAQNDIQGGQTAEMIQSDRSDYEMSVTLRNGIEVDIVFGNITQETTDAVVNSTNFKNFDTGVCKAILALAGPEVEAELQSASVEKGGVFVTQPGGFPCLGLLHVCGKADAAVIKQLMSSIVQYCEAYEWESVALPAICAGGGGLPAAAVAAAMLSGLNEASSIPLFSLVNVRLVLDKIDVFSAFKEEATRMVSDPPINASLPQTQPPPKKSAPPPNPPPPAPLSPAPVLAPVAFRDAATSSPSSPSEKSVFKIIGMSKDNIAKAKTTMKEVYQAHYSSKTFKKGELDVLIPLDLSKLKTEIESLGLQVQYSKGDWIVTGQTVKVNQLIHLMQNCMYATLTREKRSREEEELFRKVTWCFQRLNGRWEKLPKEANYQLEHKTQKGILDEQGEEWVVNLKNMEATKKSSTEKVPLKRLEHLPDFNFPLYWDNMAADENLKVVPLLPSCEEFEAVKLVFQLTCSKAILKIERVQNIHLRRSYEAQLRHIMDKNKQTGGANEKLLYHGTTQENATSIMNTGFNRRFSGQNATSFGKGTYFALQANYSAHPTYSKPDNKGTQLMFLSRVLTGLYALGNQDMIVPPPRNVNNPHERFDSAVDDIDRPNMYIVFHDNQAYPDYLITFK